MHTAATVYLVGAGPGDPELLTVRALRLIETTEVVVYDRLVSGDIIDLVPSGVSRIYVGKEPGRHSMAQEEISQLLVRLARTGHRVVRLKGGDPFMFGRGGEEIEALAAEGIPVTVVPGVTAANGCAAYAGIPLTHRDHAQGCLFVTGHAKSGGVEMDWEALMRPNQTVAIFMGLSQLRQLMDEFTAHGAAPEMPVAVIDNGTRPNQRVVTGTVATIAELVEAADLQGPAMIVIGNVVSMREKLFPKGATLPTTR